jgi:hypothetical protein
LSLSISLYFLFAILLSLIIAYFQYYFKVKAKAKINLVLFFLKALSLFFLFLLLINPKIKQNIIENIKPELSLLVDNSKSISFFKEKESIKNNLQKFRENKALNDKFTIKEYSFGSFINTSDSLSFSENQTNLYDAIQEINELQKNKIAPIVLFTDGNQTIGADYEFVKSKLPIYPIVFGDTTNYTDLNISQLNVNKYSFIKNKFPVEAIINYDGNNTVNTQFTIKKSGKTVFRKNIRFSSGKKSTTVLANLTSTNEGLQYYTASITPLENEKNLKNNFKNFSVEVINEQTKVLIVTSILHPDIGALKKSIESNKQRSVEVLNYNNYNNQINDYQLIIVYQPNNKFNKIFNDLKQQNKNVFIITGTNTDWSFLNSLQLGVKKNAINKSENFGAIYNNNFLTFFQNDIGFENFPPLKDKFGELSIDKEFQILLNQNINGVRTQQPLFLTLEENNQKLAFLFGEGLWKWRATNFINNNSFKEFDEFLGNISQYIASNKRKDRLKVNSENLYPSNSTINIAAFYSDENYKFDSRASITLTLTNNQTNKNSKFPFSLINNSFQVAIDNLSPGDYSYKVEVLGQRLKKYGRFRITDFEIEEQFTNANVGKLNHLALNSKTQLFYKNQTKELIEELLKNENYYTIQKSKTKEQNLIDWKWILFLIILLLSTEWFLRKYYGKI